MLVDLLDVWKKHNKTSDPKYQNTFSFTSPPTCVFIKDLKLAPASSYNDLEELKLSKTEQEEAEKKKEEILATGGYDGDQFFIKNLIYNPNDNVLYVGLLRTKFSVLLSLPLEKRLNLNLYKAGVLSPTITNDNEIVCLERSKRGFYSVVAGLIEKKGEMHEKINDLIKTTAIEENVEELYGDSFDLTKIDKQFKLVGISFTKSRGFIEFIVNFQDKQISTDKFLDIYKNSKAKDRSEHTQNYFTIPLNEQVELEKTIKGEKPGGFLYIPIAMCNSKTINNKNIIFKAPSCDNFVSRFTSLTNVQFKTEVPKQIAWTERIRVDDSKKSEKQQYK